MIVYKDTATDLPGLLYDFTDFVTPETGIGHGSAGVWIRKPGGTIKYPYALGSAGSYAAFKSIATGGSTTTLIDSKIAGKYADDYFNGLLIRTLTGTGSGQNLTITDYDGSSGTFTFITASAVDNTTEYRICKGVADSGSTNTLVDSILTDADDYWNGFEIQIIAGTGAGQVRTVLDFVQSSNTITVSENWSTPPDGTSVYSLSDKWINAGGGEYVITLDAGVFDTVGILTYTITDDQTEIMDFNGAIHIEIDPADIKTETDKIPDIKTETDKIPTILTDVVAIKARTDVINTAPEDVTDHGAGPWTSGIGDGANDATINVKDQSAIDVADALVTIHNSSNDDAPVLASGRTDANGNVTLNLAGLLYVRVLKTGFVFTSTQIDVGASATYNVTGTTISITGPAGPDLSTCFISVHNLDGSVVTSDIELTITKHDDISKDSSGNFATSTGIIMTYDPGSETWQADIKQGAHVNITSVKVFGIDDNGTLIDRDFNVSADDTTDLGVIRIS